jgi:RNA polymerase sigma-70 factor, ECF subfamily
MKISTEQIWDNYHQEIYRFIRSRIKDADTAKDVLQDVFIKVHLNGSQIKEESKIKPWLYQVTRNIVHDHFRKQKPTLDIDEMEVAEEKPIPVSLAGFETCLVSFLPKLPEKYREAVTIVDLQNSNQLELAVRLNISYSALKSRVQRGRQLLKKYFVNCCRVSADKYGNIISYKPTCSSCGI